MRRQEWAAVQVHNGRIPSRKFPREERCDLYYADPERTGVRQMQDITDVQQHIDRLYSELSELKRALILRSMAAGPDDEKAWQDQIEASEEISNLWTGADAVEEIREQREK
jgi:hypothetical protein